MAWNASALSLGSPRGNVVLGAPFDLVVGLQPDSGNDAGNSCVRAELLAGDRPIESSRVSVSPTSSGKAVRVQARYTVDEPIVTLKLWAGCDGGISRSYTLLAQLPDSVDATGNQPINVRELAAAQPALPAVGAAAAAAGAGAAGVAGTASESSSTPSRAAAARSARPDARPATAPASKEAQPQPKPKPRPNRLRKYPTAKSTPQWRDALSA